MLNIYLVLKSPLPYNGVNIISQGIPKLYSLVELQMNGIAQKKMWIFFLVTHIKKRLFLIVMIK